jgi:hypothetical protein
MEPELAALSNIGWTTLANIECGVQAVSLPEFYIFAAALGMAPSDLLSAGVDSGEAWSQDLQRRVLDATAPNASTS